MLTTRRLVLALILSPIAAPFGSPVAQSQERRQHRKRQSKNPQQPTEPDQRGTEQSPLAVKVIPAPKSQEEAAREEQERAEKARLDRDKAKLDGQLVEFNGDLAHYTELLFWVAVFQFVALFIQAIFLGLTFHTARKALRGLERAIIFGGAIIATPARDENGNMILMPEWANYGRSFALLQEIRIGTSDDEPISSTPDYSQLQSNLYDFVVHPNAQIVSDEHVTVKHSSEKPFYCFGYFKYLDIFRRQHTSRFCGRVHPDNLRFESAGHPAWHKWD